MRDGFDHYRFSNRETGLTDKGFVETRAGKKLLFTGNM